MRTYALDIPSRADGLKLSALIAEPAGEARGLVQIAHGMAEHKRRYLPFMEALADAGYAALIHDHRGHGASVETEDDLGWFGAKALVDDMRQLTELFTARYPGLPVCLLGHSMGSLAARAYVREDDSALGALIVSGCPGKNPALGAGLALARILRTVRGDRHRSALLDRLTSGPLERKMPEGSKAFAWLNTDEAEVDAYVRDERCGFVLTVSGFEALFTLMRQAYARDGWTVSNPDMPVLFLSGADDPCMISREKLDAAVARMREVGYLDVALKVYDRMRHEILREPNRAQVYGDVITFLNRTLNGEGGAHGEN